MLILPKQRIQNKIQIVQIMVQILEQLHMPLREMILQQVQEQSHMVYLEMILQRIQGQSQQADNLQKVVPTRIVSTDLIRDRHRMLIRSPEMVLPTLIRPKPGTQKTNYHIIQQTPKPETLQTL